MIIKVDGQWIYDDGDYLRIHIRELWWGAYKVFGWENGVAGIGINEKILTRAERMGRKLKLSYYKNRKQRYHITPSRFRKLSAKHKSTYIARNKVKLLVIPVSELDHELINLSLIHI